jgi:uncharacterized protein (TIGR00251 family)
MPILAKDTLVRVRVQPRASRDEILGWRADDVLGVRVMAAPVEGQANIAVAGLVATALGVRRSVVKVVRGERGRNKVLCVAGLSAAEVRARLTATGGR